MMDDATINAIVDAIVQELLKAKAAQPGPATLLADKREAPGPAQDQPLKSAAPSMSSAAPNAAFHPGSLPAQAKDIKIDLPDAAAPEQRTKPGIHKPLNPDALEAMIASTTSRIGVGRAGPRYRTAALLLLQADHAVTQDALMRDVDQKLLDEFGLFSVQTDITEGKQQYLLRPDLGRGLSEAAKRAITEKCVKSPNIQLCIGDGLSAAAIEANLRTIFPVIKQGIETAHLSFGTPFFIKYCRVGVINDIGSMLKPDVVILLIGERPGLGRAESMSAYMAFRPKPGDTDADRDVVCNIFENGGTNPLEAGAVVVQTAQKMLQYQASGVKLKLASQ